MKEMPFLCRNADDRHNAMKSSRNIEIAVDSFQQVVQSIFPPTIRIQGVQPLGDGVHSLRVLRLSDNQQLILKASPPSGVPLLRRERHSLETEALALSLLGKSATPCIPRLHYYSRQRNCLGSSFLLRQYVRGKSLRDLGPSLSNEDRAKIDRRLGSLVQTIGSQTSPKFGTLDKVAAGAGTHSWRLAFLGLFEELLHDAEDRFIHLPYGVIRQQILRLAPALDSVTVSRLVIVDLGRQSKVILDPDSKELNAIVDLGSAIWGDILMTDVFESPSEALLAGFGSIGLETPSAAPRLLL